MNIKVDKHETEKWIVIKLDSTKLNFVKQSIGDSDMQLVNCEFEVALTKTTAYKLAHDLKRAFESMVLDESYR